MFSSPLARKVVRVAISSVATGGVAALLLLGGPADAAPLAAAQFGRGFN